MKEVLKYYKERLINTSQRSKSIFLPKTQKSYFLDLHRVDFLENQSSFSVIDDLIAGKKTALARLSDSRSEENNLVSKELKEIFKNSQFLLDETGAKNLYLGWPFLRGTTSKGMLIRAPLLLFPIELKIENGKWMVQAESGVAINKSLFYAISKDENLPLDKEFLDQDLSLFSNDSIEFRTQLYNSIKQTIIDIDFGVDTFRDVLVSFVSFSKEDFRNVNQIGRYKIFNEAIIGIFSLSDGYFMPDYDEFMENQSLLEEFEKLLKDKKPVNAQRPLMPFACDIWQENALSNVLSGNSLVIQGPPGSGKSQLISNLILNLIYQNKKILVVSQKKQALEVIFGKLYEAGFDQWICFVKDFKKDQKKIYSDLLSRIEKQDYLTQNFSPHFETESELANCWNEIDTVLAEIETLRKILFDDTKFGISPHDLYHRLGQNVQEIRLAQAKEYLHFNHRLDLQKKLRIIHSYRQKFSNHIFSNRVSFAHFTRENLSQIKDEINNCDILKEKLNEFYEKMMPNDLNYQITFSEIDFIVSQKDKLSQIVNLLSDEIAFELFRGILEFKFDYSKVESEYELLLKFLNNPCLQYASIEEVIVLQSKLIEAIEKQKNIFSTLAWGFLSRDKLFINRYVVKENLSKEKKPFQILLGYIDNRLNVEHLRNGFLKLNWVSDFPEGFELKSYQEWFEKLKKANLAKELFCSLKHITHLFEMKGATSELIIRKLDRIYILAEEIKLYYNRLLNYFTIEQVEALLANEKLKNSFIETLEADFDDLVYFDKFLEDMPSWQKELFDACFELEVKDFNVLWSIVEQNMYLHFIKVLESESPELALVSTHKFEILQQVLQDNLKKIIQLSQETLYGIANKKVELPTNKKSDLVFQLNKKRNVMPLRKLIENYSEVLMEMLPCWMVSTDSVSAIFPLNFKFDVVIFDEASQCFAEKGIPSLFRCKQAIVCGDPKQLQPSSFYQDALGDENDHCAISILEFSQKYFEQTMLKGHYRSENPLMIEFSNRFFYNGQLRFLEHFQEYISKNCPISYIKTPGKWENMQNLQEAHKVIEIVSALYQKGEYSIGVVSFNFNQQKLIEDLAESLPQVSQKLLIRNIENIQGDERDFIILTLGYAKDENGKLKNYFGALNQPGGENRLNVAVTRARKHIFLVSGLESSDFVIEDNHSEGTRLLSEYFKFAQNPQKFLHSDPSLEPTEAAAWQILEKVKEHRKNLGILTKKGLLLSDDPNYLKYTDLKDVYGYLPLELERKEWAFKRLYARNLWLSRQKFEFEVKRFEQP